MKLLIFSLGKPHIMGAQDFVLFMGRFIRTTPEKILLVRINIVAPDLRFTSSKTFLSSNLWWRLMHFR